MFKKDQIVVYRLNVCRVTDILPDYRNGKDYYELRGVHDTTLVIKTPVTLANSCARLMISGDEAKKLVDGVITCTDISTDSDTIQKVCDIHLKEGSHKDLLRIIKAHYNQRQQGDAKPYARWSERDKSAFRNAERVLYRELGAALGKTADAARKTIYEQLTTKSVGAI